MDELQVKLRKIRDLLEANGLDALLLERVANFAWATCGAISNMNVAETYGTASLLITPTARYVITSNAEAALLQEEQALADQGWQFRVAPWNELDGAGQLWRGLKLGADHLHPDAADLEGEISALRSALVPQEIDRFRALSSACAEAMDAAILAVHPGLTEHQIAAMLAREALIRGVEPIVHLVGTDERLYRHRHPPPTSKRLERFAMLVLCGRKWGLVASITRLVHFGRLPEELLRRANAVAQVDAHLISATRPGRALREVFREAVHCYELHGYPDEWRQQPQGGLAGYAPREVVATPETDFAVAVGQVYAWSPSIAGTRSEDTILVGEQQNEILTAIPRWPVQQIQLRGQIVERPQILVAE